MVNTVRDWMNDLVVFVDPNSLVTEALGIMRRRYVNNLIAKKTKDSPEYGIITSIDICDTIVAQGRDPSKVKVHEIMSTPLITVTPEMTIDECARVMKEKRIHHLPVADANGTIVGMISANDFLIVAEQLGHGDGDRLLR
ncbi:MAG: CBS domain-containing protein [Bellilinea sp.]